MFWSFSEVASAAKDASAIAAVVCPVLWAFHRYVLRPRLIDPARKFSADVRKGINAIQRIEPDVTAMKAALGPNGGKSLADLITRTDGRVNLIVRALPWATWEAAADGACVYVNQAYESLVGYSAAELLGFGWKNVVHPDDVEWYFDLWSECVSDVRTFRVPSVRFVTRAGATINVNVLAQHVPAGNGRGVWMGQVTVQPSTAAN